MFNLKTRFVWEKKEKYDNKWNILWRIGSDICATDNLTPDKFSTIIDYYQISKFLIKARV